MSTAANSGGPSYNSAPAAALALNTPRLLLRAFETSDAHAVAQLCNDKLIYETTLAIPFPYAQADAIGWISTHASTAAQGAGFSWAITLAKTGELLGAIGLHISRLRQTAELGYWLGVPHWGQGFTTEAARAVIAHALTPRPDGVGLVRVHADHLVINPASGRVLEKVGMTFIGETPSAAVKHGQPVDTRLYAVTGDQWLKQQAARQTT